MNDKLIDKLKFGKKTQQRYRWKDDEDIKDLAELSGITLRK